MKNVVLIGCEYKRTKKLIDQLGTKDYVWTALNSTDHAEDEDFIETEGLSIISVGFIREKPKLYQIAAELLGNADIVIVHRETMINYLVELYDFIGPAARKFLPTKESLRMASNKHLMRQALEKDCSHISAHYIAIDCESERIEEQIRSIGFNYPVILKPANEMSSLYVDQFPNEEALVAATLKLSKQLIKRHARKKRQNNPFVVIEEFIEGDMYTIASWVDEQGNFTHFPLVRVLNANDIGRRGFFLYSRNTLRVDSAFQKNAELAAEQAVNALKLRATSLHIELIHTHTGFKVIEIGARVGGYRQWLYETTYGVDCFMNDFNVRSGGPVSVEVSRGPFAAAIQLFPQETGTIESIEDISAIEQLPSYSGHRITKQAGDKAGTTRHGVMGIGDVLLTNTNYQELLEDIQTCKNLPTVKIRHDTN